MCAWIWVKYVNVYVSASHPQRISVGMTWKLRAHPGNRPSVWLSSIISNHHRSPTQWDREVETGGRRWWIGHGVFSGFTQWAGKTNLQPCLTVIFKFTQLEWKFNPHSKHGSNGNVFLTLFSVDDNNNYFPGELWCSFLSVNHVQKIPKHKRLEVQGDDCLHLISNSSSCSVWSLFM